MDPALRQFVVALPDFATALLFALTWWRPSLLGRHWVRDLTLTMLLEFIVLHSFAFLVLSLPGQENPRLWLAGTGALYLLMAGVFALVFRSAWPLLVMGWLVGSKLFALQQGAPPLGGQGLYALQVWAVSFGAYLGGLILTAMLPLPRLGIVEPGSAYGLPAGARGAWADEPQRVLAFGLLYFTAVGVARIAFQQG